MNIIGDESTMTEYIAIGKDYILTTEENIAEKNNMHRSLIKGRYIVFPNCRDVYDFTDAQEPVWVGGKTYNTCVNGYSSPVNVQGEIIEITKVCKCDATEFAEICFIVKRGT